MSAIEQDFRRELEDGRRRFAGRPLEEMTHLFLLALEREEIVAVGYREGRLRARIERMPVGDEVKSLLRHALLWAWRDEEMHAIYIRGAILRLGSWPLRLRAVLRQAAGAVGGWSTSVRQHARWSEAPIARALATAVTAAGAVGGKVPRHVRGHLEYRSLREFCLFNVDAERTAWLCWSRLLELARETGSLPPELQLDFARIVSDEANHERVFQAIADALNDQDRLVAGASVAGLAQALGAVSEFFLPRRLRSTSLAGNPIGGGGRVHVRAGGAETAKLAAFRALLGECGLDAVVRARAAAAGRPVAALRVAIKPTFMLGYHRKDPSPLTDPALVAALAEHLHQLGPADVAVIEGRNIYENFFRNRGVHDVARYFGIASPGYRVVDAADEQVPHRYLRGMAQHSVSRTWKDADLRISFAKMRSHPIELALLTVGNVEWLGARCDQFLFAERQAQRETAVMTLVAEFPPHFALLDAWDQVPDGVLGVMGCPRPKTPRRFYAAADALALDLVAAGHLGVRDPRDSSILKAACDWFGNPAGDTQVIGTDEAIAGWRGPYHDERSAFLSFLAWPVYVAGSGRGSLFVPEMDEQAFPPSAPVGPALRLARGAVRRLVGLRHPAAPPGGPEPPEPR